MKLLTNQIFAEHDTGAHPENRSRLAAFAKLPPADIPNAEPFLTLVHTPAYIQRVKQACSASRPLDPDTLTSPKSYPAAVAAVGATIAASETGDFALVRPPGHHAHPERSGGFCIFNNIAIAVQKLVKTGKKILIFDFDGHVGDGTAQFFYGSNRVLYWSVHQFPSFPGWGTVDEIGEGEGKGYTLNVPLPSKAGDDVVEMAVAKLLPIARRFKPDAVAVSAGFDGHASDPLLSLNYSTGIYFTLGKILLENFNPIFATLEGGYSEALPKCIQNFVDGVNGRNISYPEERTESTILTIEAVGEQLATLLTNLKPYWHS